MKGLFPLLGKKTYAQEEYYENSTQKWLPLADIKNGIIVLKDGRYIKLIEVLPVNFYLKSEVEQENIIFYFASYLKIAPDNMQMIRYSPAYHRKPCSTAAVCVRWTIPDRTSRSLTALFPLVFI